MPELVIHVGNCLIGGNEYTQHPDGQVLDVVRFNVGGQSMVLRQQKDFIRNRGTRSFKGQFMPVTTFHCEIATDDEIPARLELANQICEMLSFVTESRVVTYGHDFPAGVVLNRHAAMGTVETFRPPFSTYNGGLFKNYVEMCYPAFVQNRGPRGLNVVFDYLYHAGKTGLAIEVHLASLFILLENLKHTYALQAGYPFIGGYFRNHGATPAAKGAKKSFKDLLNAMFGAVGMNPNMDRIISLRNDLIHSGLMSLNDAGKFQLLEEINDIVREYILRLLNFHGTFYCYTLGQSRTI